MIRLVYLSNYFMDKAIPREIFPSSSLAYFSFLPLSCKLINMRRIISIANQKGGVGKTTTAINLSSALAELGKKVLLVDFDSQGNATRGLGFQVIEMPITIFDAITSQVDVNAAIKTTKIKNLDLIPANLKLASLETYIQSQGTLDRFRMLESCLNRIQGDYDFVIIDCPPSLGTLSINALVASSSVLIPVQCEYFAMEAVASILSTITKIQKDYNPSLKIEGFLLTMYESNASLCTEVAQQVRALFKENTFVTSIPRNISIPEASARGEAVTTYRPSARGSIAYFALAREVLDHVQKEN